MANPILQSRILTLVFSDLVDSTLLKTQRGDAAIEALMSRHAAHVKRISAECSGRVIKWIGDGCFLTFETSSSAVLFALRLEMAHAEEPDLPGVRVGIHMGEVTEITGDHGAPDIAGLAADIASRVCGLAGPGQILMSSAVYDSARQRISVETLGKPILWQAHGTYSVKGFDKEIGIGEAGVEGLAPMTVPATGDKARLVRRPPNRRRHLAGLALGAAVVLALLGVAYFAGGSRNRSASPTDATDPITSLAVLPLDNLMNDPEQDYFADGMTEAVTAELSKIRALKVISRTSVMRYKDTIKTAPEIAKELGVQGLIEGSVMRDGNKIRITVQLIDARTDAHLWAETYDGTLDNVFELHSTVALAVANEIRATVTPDERARIARDVPVNPEAYEFYLRAITDNDGTLSGFMRAAANLDQALRIAPDFAEAWGAKARAMQNAGARSSGAKADYMRQANDAVNRALDLAPDDAFARFMSSGLALNLNLDWEKAAAEATRSVELNPNLPEAHIALSMVAMMAGDIATAREASLKIVELDPHSAWNRGVAALNLTRIGDQTESLQIYDALLAEYPNNLSGVSGRTTALTRMGRYEDAIAAAVRFDELAGGTGQSRMGLAVALGFAGRAGDARRIGGPFLSGKQDETVTEVVIAEYYISIGETELALDSLEKAMDPPDVIIVHLVRMDPFVPGSATAAAWAPVLESPRFWKLMDRMNFPPFPPGHPGYELEQRWLAQKKAAADANAPGETPTGKGR